MLLVERHFLFFSFERKRGMDDIPFLLSIEHSIAYARERELCASLSSFFSPLLLAFGWFQRQIMVYAVLLTDFRFYCSTPFFFFFGAPSLG